MGFTITWHGGFPKFAKIRGSKKLVLPESFTARWDFEGDHTVEFDVAVEDGAAVCDAIRILRRPGGPSLSAQELRRLPVANWLEYACAMAALERTTTTGDDGKAVTTISVADAEDAVGAIPVGRRRTFITDEYLENDVARVWLSARREGLAPTREVQEQLHLSARTASRYVKLARDRGYLKKGEQE